ncbi:MAG: 50S ribosomal protein L29 [Methanospirillaceae archaeon]|nr:50S ribosomal protein L29 [Methanospirillaceae archaeon]
MALFRARDVSQLSDVEIIEQIDKLKMDLIQYRGKVSSGGAPENPGKIGEIRRTIARLMTEQNQRKNRA